MSTCAIEGCVTEARSKSPEAEGLSRLCRKHAKAAANKAWNIRNRDKLREYARRAMERRRANKAAKDAI